MLPLDWDKENRLMRINSKVTSTRQWQWLQQTVPQLVQTKGTQPFLWNESVPFWLSRQRCHKSYGIIETNTNKEDHSLLAFVILNESVFQMSDIHANKNSTFSSWVHVVLRFYFCFAFVLPCTHLPLQLTIYDIILWTTLCVCECKVSGWAARQRCESDGVWHSMPTHVCARSKFSVKKCPVMFNK